jgi:hypothetical protein
MLLGLRAVAMGGMVALVAGIDAHHLVRQIRYETPGPAASNGIATTTVTFPRYGVPVSFTPPPAGQTADITSQLLQQAAASSG